LFSRTCLTQANDEIIVPLPGRNIFKRKQETFQGGRNLFILEWGHSA
jgi:hypothetical protein